MAVACLVAPWPASGAEPSLWLMLVCIYDYPERGFILWNHVVVAQNHDF